MPTYDYECQTCHHRFEVKQSFSSEPVANCPNCQNGARRLIHSVPVMFKGSGFYVNDYRKGRAASGSESKDPAAEKGSETKTKSETKAESKAKSDTSSKAEPKKEPTSAK